MAPGANPMLLTRWENGAVGTLAGHRYRKLNIISIQVMGKYRLNATINDENLPERIQTRIANWCAAISTTRSSTATGRPRARSNIPATTTSTPTGTTRPSRPLQRRPQLLGFNVTAFARTIAARRSLHRQT